MKFIYINLFLLSFLNFSSKATIIITEIMYHPSVADTTIDDGLYEFLEFKNTGTTSIDASGYLVESGVLFLFPNGTIINPGEYVVIVSDLTAFSERYPTVTPLGVYSGRLNNGGETISLVTSTGTTVTEVTYNDASPWPSVADGFGFSLVPMDENSTSSQNTPTYWNSSSATNGSPGASNQGSNINYKVVVNEVLSSSSTNIDKVELYNYGSDTADISHWFLTDNRSTPKKYSFPANTKIPPNGYYVINESSFNPFDLGFSFSSKGDQTYIYSANENKELTGYSHGFSFAAQYDDISFGRYINSLDEEFFIRQSDTSFNEINSAPLVGPLVIDRIMYNPSVWLDEYITITNISNVTQPLYTSSLIDSNEYRVEGINFKFPYNSAISLEPGEFLVLTNILPETFSKNYNLTSDIQVFQYTGSLNNSTEKISLEAPIYRDILTNGEYDNHYTIIDEVTYNKNTPWPSASGNGNYIIRLDSSLFGTDPNNWVATYEPLVVGINDDITSNEIVLITPTLINDKVTISCVNDINHVDLLNINGEIDKTITKEFNNINLANLKPGYYILKSTLKNGTIHFKKVYKK